MLGFIQREHPLVLAVNFADPKFQVEVCFVSSHKRLDIAGARLRELPGVRRVFTSNLAARADPDCLLVDYDRYLNSDPMVADNAGLMLLKLLARCGARQAVLAGFDGFLGRGYYSREATLALNDADALERQRRIGEQLSLLPLELTFLTPSAYEGKGWPCEARRQENPVDNRRGGSAAPGGGGRPGDVLGAPGQGRPGPDGPARHAPAGDRRLRPGGRPRPDLGGHSWLRLRRRGGRGGQPRLGGPGLGPGAPWQEYPTAFALADALGKGERQAAVLEVAYQQSLSDARGYEWTETGMRQVGSLYVEEEAPLPSVPRRPRNGSWSTSAAAIPLGRCPPWPAAT